MEEIPNVSKLDLNRLVKACQSYSDAISNGESDLILLESLIVSAAELLVQNKKDGRLDDTQKRYRRRLSRTRSNALNQNESSTVEGGGLPTTGETRMGMETIRNAARVVGDTDNLEALLVTLRKLERVCVEADVKSEDYIDFSSLPTYGGQAPRDTAGVWSWDETRVLVGQCVSDFEIVSREMRGQITLSEGPNKMSPSAMTTFVLSFPSLRKAPGVDPWDADLFLSWAVGGLSHGERCAAQFVLGVWNPSSNWDEVAAEKNLEGRIGRFDLFDAMSVWDDLHRGAFLAWCKSPFWP